MVIQGGSTQVIHAFSKDSITEFISDLEFAVSSHGFTEFSICKDLQEQGFTRVLQVRLNEQFAYRIKKSDPERQNPPPCMQFINLLMVTVKVTFWQE